MTTRFQNCGRPSRFEWVMMALLLLAVMAFRLARMDGPLDDPSWRQVWCAYQAQQIFRESPPDWLCVKINYMGRRDVSVWNFPLYEDLVGAAYKVAGRESLPMARTITLLFWCGSAFYLFAATRLFAGTRAAAYATTAYMILPLSLFYSRAIHYDVAVLFFCHAMLFHGLRRLAGGSLGHLAAVLAAACLAMLIKPPYAFYFGLPLLVWGWLHRPRWTTPFRVIGFFILPLACGWSFDRFRLHLDRDAVLGPLYPFVYSKESARNFFFGSLALRLNPQLWHGLLGSVVRYVTTPIGLLMCIPAVLPPHGESRTAWLMTWSWVAGTACYVLLVFPMVTSPHDYYLLPLVAPASVLVGVGLSRIAAWLEANAGWWGRAIVALLLLLFTWKSEDAIVRGPYFRLDHQFIAAGNVIRTQTRPDDLIVITAYGRTIGNTDPRQLYWADRRGWAIRPGELDEKTLALYRGAGARYAAVIQQPEADGGFDIPALHGLAVRRFPLRDPDGRNIGDVLLVSLVSSN